MVARCERFDTELTADARRVGGPKYADPRAMAYRQAIAAHKLVADPDGAPMFFSKEWGEVVPEVVVGVRGSGSKGTCIPASRGPLALR